MPTQRTPTGQRAAETPAYDLGYTRHVVNAGDPLNLFGDPQLSSVVTNSARSMSVETMLEMLTDWRIAFLQARVAQPVISAPWKIACADEKKRAFFEAMWEPLHRPFMLMAVMGIPMGFVPLIKRWEFAKPAQTEAQRQDKVEPWSGSATPYIITGFEQIAPNACEVHVSDDQFAGIRLTRVYAANGPKIIPPHFALWLTRGLEDAFGDYRGRGRLAYCYKSWWENMFSMALRVHYIGRWANPPVMIGFPPGVETEDDDPTSVTLENKAQAMAVGQAIRGGATVVVPTLPYIDGEGKWTSLPRWTVEVMNPPDQSDIFDRIDDRDSANMSLGYLVPPQSYMNARAGGLVGDGKTVTEVLTETVLDMSLYEWETIAAQVNEYLFAKVSEFNFPANTPPARLVGTGPNDRPQFNAEDLDQLKAMIDKLAGRGDVDMSWFDIRKAAERFGWPTKEPDKKPEPEIVQVGPDGAPLNGEPVPSAAPAQEPKPGEPKPKAGAPNPKQAPKAAASLEAVTQTALARLAQNGVISMAMVSDSITAPIENELMLYYEGWASQTANNVAFAAEHPEASALAPGDVAEAAVLSFAAWLKDKLHSYGFIYWEMWAGPVVADEALSMLSSAISDHQGYVDGSLAPDLELLIKNELTTPGASLEDRIRAALMAQIARVSMYAGFLWIVISLARAWPYIQAGLDPLVRWDGPVDGKTCPGCVEQVEAGWRPLSRTPSIGTQQCLTRCRHWLSIKGVDEP